MRQIISASARTGMTSNKLTMAPSSSARIVQLHRCWKVNVAAFFDANKPIYGLQQIFPRVPARRRPPARQQLLSILDKFGIIVLFAKPGHLRHELLASAQDRIDLPPSARPLCGFGRSCKGARNIP